MVEINGEQYERIPDEPKMRVSRSTYLTMMMAQALSSMGTDSNKTGGDPMPDVNIVEEYKKILEKKSTLSRKQRDWVTAQFKWKYRKV
jgi:hypothetical protein